MATGCDEAASVALDRQNLETSVVTRDLYLCAEHVKEIDGPGTSITTTR
jgi:hypothetical protein